MYQSIEHLKGSIVGATDILSKMHIHIEDITIKYKESEERNEELQELMILIRAENDRLVRLMFEKVQGFRKKQKEMQQIQMEVQMGLRQELDFIAQQNNNVVQQIQSQLIALQESKKNQQIENQGLNRKVIDLENKLNSSLQEIDRINKQNNEMVNELEIYQNKLKGLEQKRIDDLEQQSQMLNSQLQEQLSLKDIELNQMKNGLMQQIDNMDRQHKQEMIQNENSLKYMGLEVDRLQQQLDQVNEELDVQKNQYAQMEDQKNKEKMEMIMEFEEIKRKQFHSSDLEKRFNAERMSYEQEIMVLRQKISELDQNIHSLKQDNNKLNQLQIERMKEIEKWRNQISFVDQDEINQLKRQLEENKRVILNTKETIVRLQSEKNNVSSQLVGLENELKNKNEELQQCYDLINMVKQDQSGFDQQNENQRREIAGYKQQISDMEYKLMVNTEILEGSKNRIQELESQNQLLNSHLVKKDQEYEQLHQQLRSKINEIDKIKEKYQGDMDNAQQTVSMKYSISKRYDYQ